MAVLSPVSAKEALYLTNGFRLEADSHTQTGQVLVLHMGQGTLELSAAEIARIEDLGDDTPPASRPEAVTHRQPQDLVSDAAVSEGLPPEFVRSVARIESGFRPDAVSPKGALGLMQLMPGTAAHLGVQATQPEQNAQGGAEYLRELLLLYHGNAALALAAYNAGPGAVARFGGVPPYAETRRYIEKVLREYARQQKARWSGAKTPSVARAAQQSIGQ